MGWCRREGADRVLEVLVSPRASRDALAGIVDGRLKIRLTAPPVEGAANEHLVTWLAREFGVPRRQVRIEHGERGRRKRIRLVSPTKFPAGLPATSDRPVRA
jgi:uncharacterized protein (TIGR00251 family)